MSKFGQHFKIVQKLVNFFKFGQNFIKTRLNLTKIWPKLYKNWSIFQTLAKMWKLWPKCGNFGQNLIKTRPNLKILQKFGNFTKLRPQFENFTISSQFWPKIDKN